MDKSLRACTSSDPLPIHCFLYSFSLASFSDDFGCDETNDGRRCAFFFRSLSCVG